MVALFRYTKAKTIRAHVSAHLQHSVTLMNSSVRSVYKLHGAFTRKKLDLLLIPFKKVLIIKRTDNSIN